jgi:hypothetical protein
MGLKKIFYNINQKEKEVWKDLWNDGFCCEISVIGKDYDDNEIHVY